MTEWLLASTSHGDVMLVVFLLVVVALPFLMILADEIYKKLKLRKITNEPKK